MGVGPSRPGVVGEKEEGPEEGRSRPGAVDGREEVLEEGESHPGVDDGRVVDRKEERHHHNSLVAGYEREEGQAEEQNHCHSVG